MGGLRLRLKVDDAQGIEDFTLRYGSPMRRQLRFALALQIAGAAFFLVAAVLRGLLIGLDPLTAFFFVGGLGAGALAIWTRQQLLDLDDGR
jgi:hypothetical protein